MGLSRDELQAHLAGVPLKTYLKWDQWRSEGSHLQAKTLKGNRCGAVVRLPKDLGPTEYETEGFCTVHWRAMNE